MGKYEKEDIIKALCEAKEVLGDDFRYKDYSEWAKENKKPSLSVILKNFSTWNDAKMELFNFADEEDIIIHKSKEINDNLLIYSLKSADKATKGTLTKDKYNAWAYENDAPSGYVVYVNFGSWENALKEAEIIEKDNYDCEVTDVEILSIVKNINRAHEETGKYLTIKEYVIWAKKQNAIPATRIVEVFGNWSRALKRADVKKQKQEKKKTTKDSIASSIKEASNQLGENLTFVQYDKWAELNKRERQYDIISEFRSWNEAKKYAGLKPSTIKKYNYEMLEHNLKKAINKLGFDGCTLDKYKEWSEENSEIPFHAYLTYYNSWQHAKESSLKYYE